ncbi:MAG: hypothetical protein JRN57_03845 [Nitrososphaerota archaeon]|nr:hypothetical protein [Nitrososphaerota archaeon]
MRSRHFLPAVFVLLLILMVSFASFLAFGTPAGGTATSPATGVDASKGSPVTNPEPQPSGFFGWSVATAPGNIGVVGEYNATEGGFVGAGAAFTFIHQPNSTVYQLGLTLVSPNGRPGGNFGWSVAIGASARVGNSSTPFRVVGAIAVGAPGETVDGMGGAGRVYVFNATTGRLISTLVSPEAQAGGGFGWSVTVSGSIVVVGAPNETENGIVGAGRAYSFNGESGLLIRTFASPNAQAGGHFGYSVGMSDNNVLNTSRVAVGAPGEAVGGVEEAGRAYVFGALSGGLIAQLESPNVQQGGIFGCSVSVTLNITAVGAPGEASAGLAQAGRAYGFWADTGGLLYNVSSPGAQQGGRFGWSVWLSEQTLAVGAPGEAAAGLAGAGGAYTFSDMNGTLVKAYQSRAASAGGAFGTAVSVVQGPVRFVGYILYVGAPREESSGNESAGNAYA